MIKHQGGCHCGNVRYSTAYDPMLVMACHCRTCKKISGVGMTVFAVYGEGEVDIEAVGKLAVLAGVKGYPARVKCATLAWHTLDTALKNEGLESISTE